MQITRLDKVNIQKAYNINIKELSSPGSVRQPFNLVWCEIPTGGRTHPHEHHEAEAFYILKGLGRMVIDNEESVVDTGCYISIPPGKTHFLENSSGREPLYFLSLYSDRRMLSRNTQGQQIFSPPPTPNGPLHLGHLSGPYLSADVLKRVSLLQNTKASHHCGSDDHQSYVYQQAGANTLLASTQATDHCTAIVKALSLANIDVDYFTRPMEDGQYQQHVRQFFERLRQKNRVVEKCVELAFCGSCDVFLSEAMIQGHCPRCDTASTGNTCETCAFIAFLGNGLRDPHCSSCGDKAIYRESRQWFFSLSQDKEKLSNYLSNTPMSDRLRGFLEYCLSKDLRDFPVSQDSPWGIGISKNNEDKTFNVWFEMAANYWQQSEIGEESVYTLGFDNSFYYAYLIPALFLALDCEQLLPKAFVVNEFYLLAGHKFSTSRDHAIWALEALEQQDSDIVRFYLASTRSELSENSYFPQDQQRFIESNIKQGLNLWISNLNKKITHPKQETYSPRRGLNFQQYLNHCVREIGMAYSAENFSLNTAAGQLQQLIHQAKSYSNNQEYLALELAAMMTFSLLAYPIMPRFSESMLNALGVSLVWQDDIVAVEHIPTQPLPLFPIDDSDK